MRSDWRGADERGSVAQRPRKSETSGVWCRVVPGVSRLLVCTRFERATEANFKSRLRAANVERLKKQSQQTRGSRAQEVLPTDEAQRLRVRMHGHASDTTAVLGRGQSGRWWWCACSSGGMRGTAHLRLGTMGPSLLGGNCTCVSMTIVWGVWLQRIGNFDSRCRACVECRTDHCGWWSAVG